MCSVLAYKLYRETYDLPHVVERVHVKSDGGFGSKEICRNKVLEVIEKDRNSVELELNGDDCGK